MTALAPTLQAFFTERLMTQRNASPRTVAAYRDTLALLLRFARQQTGKEPRQLDIDDLDAPLIGAFLDHLERERGNGISTRNARLAAIHSLFRYASLRHPEHAHTIARVIDIPSKKHARPVISYLNTDEIKALLEAPDLGTWLGRRDHAILLLAIQAGLRVSELTGLNVSSLAFGTGAHVLVLGKGRKHRSVILTRETVSVLEQWCRERGGEPNDPLFTTRRGDRMTSKAVAWLLDKHAHAAAVSCPSLAAKRVTPHVLRHTNAMMLRGKNVDIFTIALWLGHESIKSTEIYLHADNKLKQEAIDRTTPTGTLPGRYQAPDRVLAFLEQL